MGIRLNIVLEDDNGNRTENAIHIGGRNGYDPALLDHIEQRMLIEELRELVKSARLLAEYNGVDPDGEDRRGSQTIPRAVVLAGGERCLVRDHWTDKSGFAVLRVERANGKIETIDRRDAR